MWQYKGGIEPDQKVRLVGQFGPCLGSHHDAGFSVLRTEQNPGGLVAISIGREAICTSTRFVRGRVALQTELAGLFGYVRVHTLDKMGLPVVDVASMGVARVDSTMIQPYLSEFWRQKHHWEVDAKKMSQGLPGGVGVRWWAKFPDDDDDAWMEINRGSVPGVLRGTSTYCVAETDCKSASTLYAIDATHRSPPDSRAATTAGTWSSLRSRRPPN